MSKFNLIVMDPPYSFLDKLQHSQVKRGAEANYSTLSFDDLLKLPIKEISADDAILALWVPSSLLPQGLELMEKYGFEFRQSFIWVKVKKQQSLIKFCKQQAKTLFQNFNLNDNILNMGMGRLFRNSHEICLIGIRGKIYEHLKDKSQRTVSFAYNLKHSAKPEILQDRLEKMLPGNNIKRIEIFARREREGWTTLGNQVGDREDIRVSLGKLIKKKDRAA